MSRSSSDVDVEKLEKECIEDASKANNISILLKLLSTSDDELKERTVHALRRVFWHLEASSSLRLSLALKERGSTTQSAAPVEKKHKSQEKETLRKYKLWLATQFNTYIQLLLNSLDSQLGSLCLHTLCSFIPREARKAPHTTLLNPNSVFLSVLRRVVLWRYTPSLSDTVEQLFSKHIDSFDDMIMYTLNYLQTVVSSWGDFCDDWLFAEEDQKVLLEHKEQLEQVVLSNIVSLLLRVRLPTDVVTHQYSFRIEGVQTAYDARTQHKGEGKSSSGKKRKFGAGTEDENAVVWRRCTLKQQRRSLGDAWSKLLKLRLSPALRNTILSVLHTDILPMMKNPLTLADFLTDTYNVGGLTSLRALDGLFVLISKHGLDYPSFFTKLYSVLHPSLFQASHRHRFFVLLDKFLSSTYIPVYLVSAFVKRLMRMALFAPPSACVFICVLAFNLTVRHSSCKVLLHRPILGSATDNTPRTNLLLPAPQPLASTATDQRQEQKEKDEDQDAVTVMVGKDPFDNQEKDPSKCRAEHSSLWEIKALCQHYNPKVSGLATKLFSAETSPKMEYDIQQFVDESNESMFAKELTWKRSKPVTLAYTKPLPLFRPCNDNFPGIKHTIE